MVDRRVVGRVERLVLDARDRRGQLVARARGSSRTSRGARRPWRLRARGSWVAAMRVILGRSAFNSAGGLPTIGDDENRPPRSSPSRSPPRCSPRAAAASRSPASAARRSSPRRRPRSSRSTAIRLVAVAERRRAREPLPRPQGRDRPGRGQPPLRARTSTTRRTSSRRSGPSSTSSGSTSRTTARTSSR